MNIIRINPPYIPITQLKKSVVPIVKKGGLIIFPTDTVYGIGCSFENKEGLERIYTLKGRLRNKPLPILLSSLEEVEAAGGQINPLARRLMEHFWPGPLTIVLKTRGNKTLGLRIPSHSLTLALLNLTGPLFTTSANLSARQSISRFEEIPGELLERVDVAVDGGHCPLGMESSVVDATGHMVSMIREGYIKRSEIEGLLGKENVQ